MVSSTQRTFCVDQDQTALNVRSDLGLTLSDKETPPLAKTMILKLEYLSFYNRHETLILDIQVG